LKIAGIGLALQVKNMLRFRFWLATLITEERNMRTKIHYRTDLTKKQWEIIKKYIPKPVRLQVPNLHADDADE